MLPSYRLFSLLTILLGLLLVQSCEGQSWTDFQKKHIDFPKTKAANSSAYCDFMMTSRRLNSDNCKHRNTFINDNPDVIANVCQGDGTPYGNFTDSKLHFSMVDCNYTGGSYPKCKYKGTAEDLRIQVTCKNGYPVHLEAILSQKDAAFTKFAPAFSFTASLLCIYISRGL